jgi:hypothetical protein
MHTVSGRSCSQDCMFLNTTYRENQMQKYLHPLSAFLCRTLSAVLQKQTVAVTAKRQHAVAITWFHRWRKKYFTTSNHSCFCLSFKEPNCFCWTWQLLPPSLLAVVLWGWRSVQVVSCSRHLQSTQPCKRDMARTPTCRHFVNVSECDYNISLLLMCTKLLVMTS